MDDSVDEKTKKTLIISGIVTGLVVAAVGGTGAVMSGGDDPKGKPGFETNTPALTQAASQQPGVISIDPLQVQLQNVDGGIQCIATVSALFQEFTVGSVQITGGDQRYSYESECLAAGKKLDAGEDRKSKRLNSSH